MKHQCAPLKTPPSINIRQWIAGQKNDSSISHGRSDVAGSLEDIRENSSTAHELDPTPTSDLRISHRVSAVKDAEQHLILSIYLNFCVCFFNIGISSKLRSASPCPLCPLLSFCPQTPRQRAQRTLQQSDR